MKDVIVYVCWCEMFMKGRNHMHERVLVDKRVVVWLPYIDVYPKFLGKEILSSCFGYYTQQV